MAIEIDKRSMWVIITVKALRPLFFLSLGLFVWYVMNLPSPVGLTSEGKSAIAVFVLCLALWVTQAIPLAVTSICAIVLVPLLGILPKAETYAIFGNEAVFFILGAFILAGAVLNSGLSNRIALVIMEKFGSDPKRLVLSIFLLSAVLSFFMSEHAVAAMLFPIVLEIAKSLELRPGKSSYGKLLFLSLAWGCVIGGVATFLGGARVPLAVGILNETTGETINFLSYTVAVFPMVVIMLFIGYFLLTNLFPIDIESVSKARAVLAERSYEMGKVDYVEYAVGTLMVVTVLSWMVLGEAVGLSTIALIAVIALFVFRLVRWKDIEEYVNWGIVLMYGGAITLGTALDRSGAAEWLANNTIALWATTPWLVIALFSLLTLLLTEGISNAAVIAILLPIGIGFAGEFSMSPVLITFVIAVPAGLAFALPMSTPANAIAVSSNYISVKDMAKAGVLMSISAWIVFNLVARYYWPLIGMGY